MKNLDFHVLSKFSVIFSILLVFSSKKMDFEASLQGWPPSTPHFTKNLVLIMLELKWPDTKLVLSWQFVSGPNKLRPWLRDNSWHRPPPDLSRRSLPVRCQLVFAKSKWS